MFGISFFFIFLVVLECFVKSNIWGVGISFLSEVYKLWQFFYVVNRLLYVDLEFVYDVVGSVEVKYFNIVKDVKRKLILSIIFILI